MRRFVTLLAAMTLVIAACSSDDTDSATVAEPAEATATVAEPAEAGVAAEFPEQVFFIGDSNAEGVAAPFVALAEARHPDLTLEATASVNFGVPLSAMFIGGRSVRLIQDGTFDVVVLEQDLETNDPAEFMEYVRKYNDEIVASGARTVLFMPWEHDTRSHLVSIADIASAYTSIGVELGVKVAPLGLAFSDSLSERPDFDLYIGDREHANPRGQYLAASVIYATIFDKSPEGAVSMSPETADKAEMSEEDVAFLDRIAWQAVTEYREGT
jgi:hypothetical protein